jgi:GTP-dependent dephospho-CoA kinase
MIPKMIQLRPSQVDLKRLKEPFGELLPGDPEETMPELSSIIGRIHPTKVVAVGDVVSRETVAAGIMVNLRIIDHRSMRKPAVHFDLRAKTTYHVRNPAGVITLESWEAIKRAMKDEDALILVDGEEDLLALPCIVESPSNSLVLYGQPSQGLVVVDTNPTIRQEASLILQRLTREENV